MNPKSTLYLVLLAGALLAYILLFEQHRPDPSQRAAAALRVFPELNPAEVSRIEIVRSNQVINVERSGSRWQLNDPTYPAQSERVEQWLVTLSGLNRRTTLSAADVRAQPAGAAAFGLEPPSVVVTVTQSPRSIHFRLGDKAAVGETAYLQLVGASDIIVTDAAIVDRLPKVASDWRDPSFVDLSQILFDRLVVTAGSSEFEIEFDPQGRTWRLVRPRVARVGDTRLLQALQQLQALRIERFVQDQPGVDLEPYGLDEPALALSFRYGTNQVFGAQFGSSPTNEPGLLFARRSDYPNVLMISRQVVDSFAVPYTEFLDYRLTDAPLDPVDQIEVLARETFTLQRQTNAGWRVIAPRAFAADPVLVQNFLSRVQSLMILDVAKEVVTDLDLPNYGLAEPSRQYRFSASGASTNSPPTTVLGLDFGTNRNDRTFVRRTDENPVYTVNAEEASLLPEASYQLRDRRLWDFSTNQVAGVTIHRSGRDYQIVRSAEGQWSFAAGSQGIVNTFALEEALFRLGKLWARAWVDHGSDRLESYGFGPVDHWLEIELTEPAEPRSLRVSFGATSPSGGPFAAIDLEGEPTVFEFPLEIFYVYRDVVGSLSPVTGNRP